MTLLQEGGLRAVMDQGSTIESNPVYQQVRALYLQVSSPEAIEAEQAERMGKSVPTLAISNAGFIFGEASPIARDFLAAGHKGKVLPLNWGGVSRAFQDWTDYSPEQDRLWFSLRKVEKEGFEEEMRKAWEENPKFVRSFMRRFSHMTRPQLALRIAQFVVGWEISAEQLAA